MQRGSGNGRRGVSTLVVTAVALAIGLGLTPAPARAKDVTVDNVRIGFANSSANNLFKIGSWTPLWIRLKGGDERFQGDLVVEVPDDDGTANIIRQTVDVPAGATVPVVAYVRPGTRDPNFTIRLVDRDGRRRVSVDGSELVATGASRSPTGEEGAPTPQQLTPLQADETLVLTLGKPSGVDLVPTLPGFSSDTSSNGHQLTVARVDAASGMAPARWYGYDAAEAVVIDTNDNEVMAALQLRGQALVDWVARGGHLVIAVGGNWQAVRDSVLAPLLPAVPEGLDRLTSLGAIDTYAGSVKPITPAGAPAVTVVKLTDLEARGGKALSVSGKLPLIVRGPYQFGRVTLVALDVDQKPFTEWADRALFWVRAADLRRRGGEVDPASVTVRGGGGGRRLYSEQDNDVATYLNSAMEQFPGVKLVPFGWVAFFIFLYILLIGPGDYFLLKKVFKRMELTWITFPSIVLAVSVIAYLSAYAVKGRDLKINKIDVVDIDQAAGVTRGTTLLNIFSPQNRDYDVAVVPLATDRPVAKPGPGESSTEPVPERPAAGTEVVTTWFGVPEQRFGAMGGSGRIGFSTGGYTSSPVGASERLEKVRVPIWSTKALTARWFGPSTSRAIESDIRPAGTDRLNGMVTNRLPVALEDAFLAFGKHVYLLGTLKPGVPVRVELSQDRQLAGQLRENSLRFLDPTALAGQDNRLSRPDLILAAMFHESQAATAEGPKTNTVLRSLDLTGQLLLDRPMLVGRVARAASGLVLGNAGVDPKIEQSTVIRVILPLSRPAKAADAPKPPK